MLKYFFDDYGIKDGDTVTLLADGIDFNHTTWEPRNATATLDLNGHTLGVSTNASITIMNNSTLRIVGSGSFTGGFSAKDSKAVLDLSGWTGGTINSVRREWNGSMIPSQHPGTKINNLWLWTKVQYLRELNGGTYGQIKPSSSSYNTTAGALLIEGYAFRYVDEDGEPGDYVPYDTAITVESPLTDVTVVKCEHTNVDENNKCLYCGGTLVATVKTTSDKTNGYTSLADALAAASAGSGSTLKLLADVSETLTVSSTIKLDCNGHTIEKLTVSGDVTLESLLPEGGAFKSNGSWINDSDLSGQTELTKATTGEAPVQYATAVNPTVTAKYGEEVTLNAERKIVGDGTSSYTWFIINGDQATSIMNDAAYTDRYTWNSCKLPTNLDAGEYTYRLTYTKEGYSKSCEFTVTIEKADAEVTKDPAAIADLTYTGSPQTLVTAGTADGGEMQYSTDGTNYSPDIPTGTDAKEYTIWYKAVGDKNHKDSTPQSVTVTIAPMVISSMPVFSSSDPLTKTYDGTTDMGSAFEITGFYKTAEDASEGNKIALTQDTDFEILRAEYTSANVGTDIPVKMKRRLLGNNYVFADGTKQAEYTTNDGSISKAIAPSGSPTIYVADKHKQTYTVDLSKLLPILPAACFYGNVTYGEPTVAIQRYYTDGAKIEDGKLILPIESYDSDSSGKIGSVTMTVSSDNYQSFELTINVFNKDGIVPQGEPILSKTTLTYGDKLSDITLSGKMQGEGEEVSGKFTWEDPGLKMTSAGNYRATWVFTPDNTKYAAIKGTSDIVVNKATPTGTPKYTAITAAGKTLSEANLTAEGGTFSVPGTVRWVDGNGEKLPDDTEVKANTGYRWMFTPADGQNYAAIYGSVTLYRVSSGGGGGAAIPSPSPANPDVITVKDDKIGSETGESDTTTKTTVKDTKTETTRNEQGQTVSKTTASVSRETAEELVKQATEHKSDTVEITVKSSTTAPSDGAGTADSVKSTELEIPKTTIEDIAKNTDADLVIKTDSGEVTLDNKTLETIAKEAKGDTVTITVNENTKLTEDQQPAKEILGKNGKLFDLAARIGEKLLHHFDGGKAHVTLPMPDSLKGKDVLVIYINDKGFCEILSHAVEKVGADSYIKFTTSHFSTFAVVDKEKAEALIKAQNEAHVKKLMKNAKFKVTTTRTSKKSVKVTVTPKNNRTLISDIKAMGYTVKYQFYRSTKKSSGYKLLKTKDTSSFTNTKGTKGAKYYYKARVLVYDGKTLIAKTALKQAGYGVRTWTK